MGNWAFVALMMLAMVAGCRGAGEEGAPSSDDGGQASTLLPDAPVGERLAPVASVGMAEAWLDLIAQRPSAVVFSEGRMLIEMGELAARRHVELARRSPWALAEPVDDRVAAVLQGRTGTLTIPLDGDLSPALHPDVDEQPQLAVAVTLRSLAPKQMVTVLWNETPIVNLTVGETWERRTISIPSELARPGENRMRLHFRNLAQWSPSMDAAEAEENTEQAKARERVEVSLDGGVEDELMTASAAVEFVEVGPVDAIRSGPPNRETYVVEPRADAGSTLRLPGGSALAYYFVPPRRARVSFEVGGHGAVEVLASTDADHRAGRPPNVLYQSSLRPSGNTGRVDLSGYAGVPTRLEIRVSSSRAREEDPSGDEGGADFRSLAVTAQRSVPMDRRRRAPRDLYVIAVEGVRYDELATSRPSDVALPSLQRMRRESLVFERAYALGAAAVPSHAGWLTSDVPPSHLTSRGTFVAEGRSLIAEVLDRAGYFNSGVSANADVNADRGLTQGLGDHQVLHRGPTKANTATGVMRQVLEQVEARPSPRFVYAVVNDPQAPYDPPQEVFDEPISTPKGRRRST